MIPVDLDHALVSQFIETARAEEPAGQLMAFAFHDEDILGTHLKLFVNAAGQAEAFAAARRARSEIDRLDQVLNWRLADSELSRLNRAERSVVSADLFAVIAAAEHWRRASKGAYSGRLGRLGDLWRAALVELPDRRDCLRLARTVNAAEVGLDAESRTIIRPDMVKFDLDGLAKGYIIDRALEAALDAPGVEGALVDIGGDIRAAGRAPGGGDWIVDLPEPLVTYDNAPVIGRVALRGQAIATSGCGPRDREIGGTHISQTLDPRTGWPVSHRMSATAMSATAADADGLATALLNLPLEAGAQLVRSLEGASARVTREDKSNWLAPGLELDQPPPQWTPVQARGEERAKSGGKAWHDRWSAFVTFTAPPRQMKRDRAFRSPYVAIWIADEQNRPVRTLVLIGSIKEWQEDNYIWWGQHRSRAMTLLNTRSMSTRGSGQYKMLWDGVDEDGNKVAPGKYVLHIETSRERGRHTHRSLDLDFTKAKAFTAEIPTSEEAGGLVVSFEKF